jgi:hypothetical protein
MQKDDPTVAFVGEVRTKSEDKDLMGYSPYVRFAYALKNEVLPLSMTTTVDVKHWGLFDHFDLICGSNQLGECDSISLFLPFFSCRVEATRVTVTNILMAQSSRTYLFLKNVLGRRKYAQILK